LGKNKRKSIQNCGQNKIKNASKIRKRRLTEDEENSLYAELSKCSNPEMAEIFGLALTTGMRRGEILELKWSNVKENTIDIERAKAGPRTVVLENEAKLVLASALKRKKPGDDRIFHYTPDGFATNWDRVKKRANIENFRFHDCRREFISRIVERISNPPVVAEKVGMSDVNHVNRQYVQPAVDALSDENGIQSMTGLLKSVGHARINTTGRYFTGKN
jgi:integrase